MIFTALLMLAGAQDVPATPSVAGTTVARPAREADGTQRWSILLDSCAPARDENEVVVCGTATADSARLPLPGERGPPDRPMPSNPDVSGMGALAASAPPCATLSQGCSTGVNIFGGATFLVRAIGKVVDGDSCCETAGEATNPGMLINDIGSMVKRTFRKKPDKSNRVPIPLDDLPAPQGKSS
jgi:hypothetical protein